MVSSSRCSAPPATRRARNSPSTLKWNPGSVSSRPSAYFQSMRARTASAACRSLRCSRNWNTVTRASQPPGGQVGLAPGGVETAEVLVLVEGAELVTQPRDQGAFGECRAGDAHRLSRDLTDRLRAQTHGSLPCWMAA